MKSLMSILFCAFLVFSVACKKKSKAAENDETIIEQTQSNASSKVDNPEYESIKDCDDFMDQYEEWMEEYVDLLDKHKENPVALVSDPEYSQMTMQAVDWASNWSVKLTTSCANNPNYEARMKEIQEKMDKKMKEIGLRK